MPDITATITITAVSQLAITEKAAAEGTTVQQQHNMALREWVRGVTENFDSQLERLIPIANRKATDAEKVSLITTLKTIASRP
jgi:hypothetical protein